jgi:DNA mismatch endonuclease (patch repair protein)
MYTVSKERRSHIMRQIRSRDTRPELFIRKKVHQEGFRFRLNNNNMIGKPDLVFPKYHLAVFVNGCFWHGHSCSRGARIPASNSSYWKNKIARNQQRDEKSYSLLKQNGWQVVIIWECELEKGFHLLLKRLKNLRTRLNRQ